MKKRVVIAGSRHFQDYARFSSQVDYDLSRLKDDCQLVILSGGCSGTDAMAERYAQEHGYELEVYPADWSMGRQAGPMRNQHMVTLADYAIAFPGGGPGTLSLIGFAKEKVIPIRIHTVE